MNYKKNNTHESSWFIFFLGFIWIFSLFTILIIIGLKFFIVIVVILFVVVILLIIVILFVVIVVVIILSLFMNSWGCIFWILISFYGIVSFTTLLSIIGMVNTGSTSNWFGKIFISVSFSEIFIGIFSRSFSTQFFFTFDLIAIIF